MLSTAFECLIFIHYYTTEEILTLETFQRFGSMTNHLGSGFDCEGQAETIILCTRSRVMLWANSKTYQIITTVAPSHVSSGILQKKITSVGSTNTKMDTVWNGRMRCDRFMNNMYTLEEFVRSCF